MPNKDKKICVFGDSIAYGYHDTDNCGWVDRIKLALNYRDFTQIFNLGISGDDSRDVLDRFDSEIKSRSHHIIIFAVGLNDTKYLSNQNKVNIAIDEYKNNISKLFSKAKKLDSAIIVVGLNPVEEDKVNPTPWNTNKSFSNGRVEKYNKVLQELSNKENLDFVDVYGEFMKYKDYKQLLYDGLHPNSKGHELIFNKVKDLLWKKYL